MKEVSFIRRHIDKWRNLETVVENAAAESPDVLADDIIENLQSALESFQEIKAQLK